ncbi:hypothetical protein [Xanthomonas sp. MUS 060]|uniref:hypothetical protein n=1 Tax=Xanthomonas sp. MUS 060 TaxID=1588031 RepID=UPI00126A33C5|nr:hypothetical protein [Xanthomonas sp. MUS 060]
MIEIDRLIHDVGPCRLDVRVVVAWGGMADAAADEDEDEEEDVSAFVAVGGMDSACGLCWNN